MKMEIWPDDVSMPEMTDWLAELRDDGDAEPAGDGPEGRTEAAETSPDVLVPAQPDRPMSEGQVSGPAESASPSQARVSAGADSPEQERASAGADSPGQGWAAADTSPTGRIRIPAGGRPAGRTRAPAVAGSQSRTRAPAKASAPAEITERAVIGDQLRMPIMWCEMGSCISWHADPAALGEADIRARAIDVGWRVDAFGRLACPQCQQTAPGFRVSRPVVLWDRHAAITRASWMAAVHGNGAAGEHGRGLRPPASRRPGASPPEPQRHREHPAAKTTTVGRHAR
jgi:hypothetical protein